MKVWLLILSTMIVVAFAGCSNLFQQSNVTMESNKQNESELATSAPEVHTISGKFSRIAIVRLKNGADILEGLKKAIGQEKIKNAVILTGVGSLTCYHIHVVDSTTLPAKQVYPKADVPQDIVNVNGYVIDGRIHAHITFSDEEKALGGHLEPGTKVLTFAIITLGILEEGADLNRFDDWKW